MNAKDKAKELVWKYLPILEGWKNEDSNKAKQCALIAVEEILQLHIWKYNSVELYKFWQEVKQEINNL
jgi:hypothetical protein